MLPWNNKDAFGNRLPWTWFDPDRASLWQRNIVWYSLPYCGIIVGGLSRSTYTFIALGAFIGVIISLIAIPWAIYEYNQRKDVVSSGQFKTVLLIHIGMLLFSVAAAVVMWFVLLKVNT